MDDKEIERNKFKHTASPLLDELDLRQREIKSRPPAFEDLSQFRALEEVDLPLYEEVMERLKEVMDPELHIDIVNLGLIYDVMGDEDKNVFVRMTLTTPFCPLSDEIIDRVDGALDQVDDIREKGIELTFDPPWHPERLSRVARIALGFAPQT